MRANLATITNKRALLGTVAPNGGAYFYGDVDDCRVYLRAFGMECTDTGWRGNGWKGVIDFHNGRHYAAAFPKDW